MNSFNLFVVALVFCSACGMVLFLLWREMGK